MQELQGIRPRELARRLGFPPSTIYRRIRNGELPAVRFGRALVILADDLENFLKANRQEGQEDGRGRRRSYGGGKVEAVSKEVGNV